MSVYNGQEHLKEAISNILDQSFSDFEFIIINDGSTDRTKQIIEQFAARDSRIRMINQKNAGLTVSLNRGINLSRGRYIARQDADDVSFPRRFEKQMSFLKKHPDVVLCGAWFLEDNEGKGQMVRTYPLCDKVIRKNIKYVNHFCHPSVIFLKEAFARAGRYDENFITAQDFELWIRLAEEGKVANIPEVLVKKRIGFSETISWKHRRQKFDVALKVISKHFGSWCEMNGFKFFRYYVPRLVYGAIPVPVIKLIRNLRYRRLSEFQIKK